MMDEMDNLTPVSNSVEEVKLLLAERLKRIAEGNAVTVQHEEVKRHIKALLDIRVLHEWHTRVYYTISNEEIVIVLFWDNRRDDKLIESAIKTAL